MILLILIIFSTFQLFVLFGLLTMRLQYRFGDRRDTIRRGGRLYGGAGGQLETGPRWLPPLASPTNWTRCSGGKRQVLRPPRAASIALSPPLPPASAIQAIAATKMTPASSQVTQWSAHWRDWKITLDHSFFDIFFLIIPRFTIINHIQS